MVTLNISKKCCIIVIFFSRLVFGQSLESKTKELNYLINFPLDKTNDSIRKRVLVLTDNFNFTIDSIRKNIVKLGFLDSKDSIQKVTKTYDYFFTNGRKPLYITIGSGLCLYCEKLSETIQFREIFKPVNFRLNNIENIKIEFKNKGSIYYLAILSELKMEILNKEIECLKILVKQEE